MADLTRAFTVENGLVFEETDVAVFSDTVDPSAGGGVAATRGSLFLRDNGSAYLKTNTADTDWTLLLKNGDVVITATQPASGLQISGSPITNTGTLTFTLANDLAALEGLGTTGFGARTAADTWALRALTGTTNRITITNGSGVSGDPTVDISSSYVGQASITTLGTITTGVWNGTTIAIANGGTGQTTALAAFNALSPLTTKGDLLTRDATNNIRVPVGTDGQVLVAASAQASGLQWVSPSSTLLSLYRENPSSPTAPTVAGTNAVAIGNGSSASGTESIVLGGLNNTASAQWSVAMGSEADSTFYGGVAQASGSFAAAGDAQTRVLTLRTVTTNNTITEMFLDGTGGSQRLVLPSDSTWTFRILIAARRTDANNESGAYQVLGAIDRNTTAGSTALVAAVSTTTIAENNAAWGPTVDADTTNGSLRLRVTGETGKNIRWVARVELVEVTG